MTCWYPLLPRRNNKEFYQEVNNYEEEFTIYNYTDVLKTVLRLAAIRHQEVVREEQKGIIDFRKVNIDLDEIVRKRQESELFEYMNSMNMNTIKVIQTAMYLGRNYQLPDIPDEQMEEYLEIMVENPDFVIPCPSRRVNNPEEVFLEWLDDLSFQKGWKSKAIEINQIYEKVPLDEYLQAAFEILGI